MNEIKNELMHFGVLGMKWGVRRAANKASNSSKKENSDFNKLKSTVKTATKDAVSALDSVKEFTVAGGGKISVFDSRLEKAAVKSGAKVDKMISSLSKKYSNVSAIPNKDLDTGKMYVDISLNGKTERITAD